VLFDSGKATLQPGARTKLKELAGLHQAGILSDEEFSAAKARILAG